MPPPRSLLSEKPRLSARRRTPINPPPSDQTQQTPRKTNHRSPCCRFCVAISLCLAVFLGLLVASHAPSPSGIDATVNRTLQAADPSWLQRRRKLYGSVTPNTTLLEPAGRKAVLDALDSLQSIPDLEGELVHLVVSKFIPAAKKASITCSCKQIQALYPHFEEVEERANTLIESLKYVHHSVVKMATAFQDAAISYRTASSAHRKTRQNIRTRQYTVYDTAAEYRAFDDLIEDCYRHTNATFDIEDIVTRNMLQWRRFETFVSDIYSHVQYLIHEKLHMPSEVECIIQDEEVQNFSEELCNQIKEASGISLSSCISEAY